jgi:hypothetical protein
MSGVAWASGMRVAVVAVCQVLAVCPTGMQRAEAESIAAVAGYLRSQTCGTTLDTVVSATIVLSRLSPGGFVVMRGSEREGYRGPHGEVPVKKPSGGEFLRIRTEERLASLISAVGVTWTVQDATKDLAGLWRFSILPPGPLEVCAMGVLIWLHAKWRRSVMVK